MTEETNKDSSIASHSPFQSRYLQVEDNNNPPICSCPVNKIAARAPSEAEVMDAYRNFVVQMQENGASDDANNNNDAPADEAFTCTLSVAQCQFGTAFESSFLPVMSVFPGSSSFIFLI